MTNRISPIERLKSDVAVIGLAAFSRASSPDLGDVERSEWYAVFSVCLDMADDLDALTPNVVKPVSMN